jgi:hypothetical protein
MFNNDFFKLNIRKFYVIRYFKDTKFKSELNPHPKQNQDV